VLVLVVAGSVARRHLTLAIILIASSFVCFGARLLVTQHRERETLSQHRRLEDQLRQAMKMEAIGRLAGGMAHDFNNLLMVVTGAAELLRRQLGPGSPHLAHVQTIQKAAQDAAELTRQLLAFSRRQKLEPKVLDLNQVVREMSPMLPRLIEESIDKRILLEPTLGRVHADPGQMQQVILNLALNARDAMPRGGTLTLETKNLELDAAAVRLHPGLRPGRYVSLRVSDSGQGMDKETRARIFEPFFTTKEKGKGTGLGLATVYGIVKQSGGYVGVDSEPGRGSIFTVLLPRHEGGIDSTPEPVRAAPPAVAGQTILLVEDSPELRGMIREFLSSQGYRVLEAEGAEAALAVARRPHESIDIVITDIVLPGMNGVRMIDEILSLRPGTPFLLMSGYADEAVQATWRPGFVVLQKPFPLELLASRIRERLAGAASEP
jgi:signal transduction histidine kinase